jgi:hypothetical protein
MVFLDLIRDKFKLSYLTFIAMQYLPAGVVRVGVFKALYELSLVKPGDPELTLSMPD